MPARRPSADARRNPNTRRAAVQAPAPPSPPTPAPLLHRSGAVARMLRMPVATLRVWERRYGVTQAQLSPSGHRLYSADEVRRLAVIKQLTDLGHAIGSLAGLTMAQLQGAAADHAQALSVARRTASTDAQRTVRRREPAATQAAANSPSPAPQAPTAPLRLAVVGASLARRLQRPGVRRRWPAPWVLQGPFDSVEQAAAALSPSSVDLLLIHAPHGLPPELELGAALPASNALAAFSAFTGACIGVLYSFAPHAACEALADAGVAMLREPQPDVVVAQWLQALAASVAKAPPAAPVDHASFTPGEASPALPIPPRRWDDAALADMAGLSSTIACECPRHVAELLVQLSHFESYSAECEHKSPADAQLHAYLRHVTASARARFEEALEQLARHEGLLLPLTQTQTQTQGRPAR